MATLNADSRRAEGITLNMEAQRSACFALLPMWDQLANEAHAACRRQRADLGAGAGQLRHYSTLR